MNQHKEQAQIIAALNEQIAQEYYAFYLYLAMAEYFEEKGLIGFAHWMKIQSNEEKTHAEKICKYMNERGWRVHLKTIKEPPFEWATPQNCFEEAYKHEQFVTHNIYNIMDMAIEAKEYPTQIMLHWFVNEQVEEEQQFKQILDKFELIKNSTTALLFLDKELGKREE